MGASLIAPVRVREGAGVSVGTPESLSYAQAFKQSGAYRDAIASAPGTQKFWSDPLVAYIRAYPFPLSLPRDGEKGDVSALIAAIGKLDGLRGGQWPAVSSSIHALADALDYANKHDDPAPYGNLGWAEILDAIGFPVAAAYDAATEEERRLAAHADAGPVSPSLDAFRFYIEPSAVARFQKSRRSWPVLLAAALAAALALGWFLA